MGPFHHVGFDGIVIFLSSCVLKILRGRISCSGILLCDDDDDDIVVF